MSYELVHGYTEYREGMSKISKMCKLPNEVVIDSVTVRKHYVDTLRPKDFKYSTQTADRIVECSFRGTDSSGKKVFLSISCTIITFGGEKRWVTEYCNKDILDSLLKYRNSFGDINGN